MKSYRLYPAAESDLENIWLYTLKTWGSVQAFRYLDDLAGIFQVLANSPTMSHERSEFTPPVRIHHHAHHLVVYIDSEGGIDIVRILHENMDIDNQLS